MLGEDQELVTAGDLMKRHGKERGGVTYVSLLSALEESGLPRDLLERRLSELFSLDLLIANFDRHLGNFGLIRDCVTLEYVGFAPTYDSGNSLWCDKRSLESPSSQLSIFVDYNWLPDVDFDGWVNEAVETLASCPNIPASRLEAISQGLRMRVGQFERHVDNRARLHPELRPVRRRSENETLSRNRFGLGRDGRRAGKPLSSDRDDR